MTNKQLKLIKTINRDETKEKLEEVNLPTFDVVISQEGNWFTEALEAIDEANESTKH